MQYISSFFRYLVQRYFLLRIFLLSHGTTTTIIHNNTYFRHEFVDPLIEETTMKSIKGSNIIRSLKLICHPNACS